MMYSLMFLSMSWIVFAQNTNQETTLADVVKALERIESRLEKEARIRMWEGREMWDFGGGPIYPFRVLLDKDKFQSFFEEGGYYEDAPMLLFPFLNGGGGTWRITYDKRLSLGFMFYGFGFSGLGFLKHDTDPNGPNATVDENNDGRDDYYSYSGYGLNAFTFVVSYRIPFEGTPLGLFAGLQAGLGSESIGFSRSPRNVLSTTLGIQIDQLNWRRMLFATGGWAGLEIGQGIVKLALEGGFDYYVPLGDWMPESGMHRLDVKPSKDINPYSVWFSIGPHFNY